MRVFRSPSIALAVLVLAAAVAHAHPSTSWGTYVLFAQDDMRIRTATIAGDVGVNDGLLYLRGTIAAPGSEFVADVVHQESGTDCKEIYANAVVGTAPSCTQSPCAGGAGCVAGGALAHPLVADLTTTCGFAPPASLAPSIDPADDVLVDHGVTTALVAGKAYRDVIVEGGGAGPAVLKLAGDYHFRNLKVGRNGSVLFEGPSNVTVAGTAHVSNASIVGPDPSLATPPAPGAIHLFVAGSQARFSRHGTVALYACAPTAKMTIGSDTTLTGRFVARSIRMKKTTITAAPPVPGFCGDGVRSPDEQCETSADCGGLACTACLCGGPTTSTNGSTTTTTTTTTHVPTTHPSTTTTVGGPTSTTTTLHPCTVTADCPAGACHDGTCVVECHTNDDCAAGSAGGGFVCVDGRCTAPQGEICGDCIDNDGDGLVDFEDPDCCAALAGQLFQMDLRHAKLRARRSGRSLLRMTGALARSGLAGKIDPLAEQVGIQIRSMEHGELFCATIPAGKFVKRKKGFVFSQKRTPLPPELGRNLSRVQIKSKKSGVVAFRLAGRRTMLSTPAEGAMQVVVGFMRPGAPASQNACSQAVRLFRGGRKGQLAFP